MIITVGFSKSKAWYNVGSLAIQLAEKRPFSHCYIKYTHPVTCVEIISQAAHGFLNQFDIDIFKQNNVIVEEYDFDVTKEQYRDMLLYIHTNLGKSYGYLELVLIAIKKLFHFEINIHDGDKTYICSEFALRICEILNIITSSIDQDYITPSDLNKLIKEKHSG